MSDRLSSPRWPGGARIETAPKNTRPVDATSTNAVGLSGPGWKDRNAATVMAGCRVHVARTAEERIAVAQASVAATTAGLSAADAQSTMRSAASFADVYRGPEKWTNGSRPYEPPQDRSDIPKLFLDTAPLTKPGLHSERRTSPRWMGGNRLDRDRGSTTYAPDFTETVVTAPAPASSRRTSPRWDGGARLDRARGPPPADTLQDPTVADCMGSPGLAGRTPPVLAGAGTAAAAAAAAAVQHASTV